MGSYRGIVGRDPELAVLSDTIPHQAGNPSTAVYINAA